MKVLNVNVLLDPIYGGGTAERTYQMSKALVRAGAECAILTTDVGLTDERVASLEGVEVVALSSIFKRFFVVRFSWSKLKSLVSSVDVIHMMGHWSMLNVLVYFLTRQTGIPYVICPAGELSLFGRSHWVKRLFNVVIGNRIVRDAAGYVAVTPDEIPAFERYGIQPEQITVIPNGINEADFQPVEVPTFAKKIGIEGAPFILFMGRLNPIKGPDLLLEGFSAMADRFPEYHLVFAGPDGGLLSSLEKAANEKGMSNRVHFVGYIAGNDKANAYNEASLLAIPSRQEAMSIVVLEAGVIGTPVLITDQCGFDEVAAAGGGLVVDATVHALENGLISLLENSEMLETMGLQLKGFVRKNYTWELISRRYLKLYQHILDNMKVMREGG